MDSARPQPLTATSTNTVLLTSSMELENEEQKLEYRCSEPSMDTGSESNHDIPQGRQGKVHENYEMALPCKKNSLKFCRKLCKIMLKQLNNQDNEFASKSFILLYSIINNLVTLFKGTVLDDERLRVIQRGILINIWKKHREQVCYMKNQKVCLVTPGEWESFFSADKFANHLRTHTNNFKDILFLINLNTIECEQAFILLYCKVFFTLNMLFIHTFLYLEIERDSKFKDKISNFDDFALMALQPWLCRYYNHTRGRFAKECCGKCKICRCYSIPANFLERLGWARLYHQQVKNQYSEIKTRKTNSLNKEEITLMFLFWTNFIWTILK